MAGAVARCAATTTTAINHRAFIRQPPEKELQKNRQAGLHGRPDRSIPNYPPQTRRVNRCLSGDQRVQLLFALTLFLSATLLFVVEPMFAKMVLPLLGGSPSVWNTCLVFYQASLL